MKSCRGVAASTCVCDLKYLMVFSQVHTDDLPSSSVVALQQIAEELEGVVVSRYSEL